MDKRYSQSLEDRWSPAVLDKGFTAVPNILIKQARRVGVNGTELQVLVTILSYQWDNKTMPFPSLKSLSKDTGLSERQISRVTSNLRGYGLISKQRRYGASNIYDLTVLSETLEWIDKTAVS